MSGIWPLLVIYIPSSLTCIITTASPWAPTCSLVSLWSVFHTAARGIISNGHLIAFLLCLNSLMVQLQVLTVAYTSPLELATACHFNLISYGSPPHSFHTSHTSLFAALHTCPTHVCLRAFAPAVPWLTHSCNSDHFKITPP